MASARERLEQLVRKRSTTEVRSLKREAAAALPTLDLGAPLVPPTWSLGYETPHWAELGEDEQLALNHWTYFVLYGRIRDGEQYAAHANRVVADALEPRAPHVAGLLRRESSEEDDHMEAFGRVRHEVARRWGFAGVRFGSKRGRSLLASPRTIGALLRTFADDFVITYFVARGIANHMGKAVEVPLAQEATRTRGPNAPLQRLSLLHTQDESHHMAVSHLLAACGRDLIASRGRPAGLAYRQARRGLLWSIARYTFGEDVGLAHERRMALVALPQLPALARRSPAFWRSLIDAHFDGLHGLQRARNAAMPRPNTRLLESAALDPDDRALWRTTLAAHQGALRFLRAEPDG